MKNAWMLRMVMGAAGLATVGIPCAYAQAEIDPDHFELSNTMAIQVPRATVETPTARLLHGRAALLARRVQSGGESLRLVTNAVSANGDGKNKAQLRWNRPAQPHSGTDVSFGAGDQRRRERSKGRAAPWW